MLKGEFSPEKNWSFLETERERVPPSVLIVISRLKWQLKTIIGPPPSQPSSPSSPRSGLLPTASPLPIRQPALGGASHVVGSTSCLQAAGFHTENVWKLFQPPSPPTTRNARRCPRAGSTNRRRNIQSAQPRHVARFLLLSSDFFGFDVELSCRILLVFFFFSPSVVGKQREKTNTTSEPEVNESMRTSDLQPSRSAAAVLHQAQRLQLSAAANMKLFCKSQDISRKTNKFAEKLVNKLLIRLLIHFF